MIEVCEVALLYMSCNFNGLAAEECINRIEGIGPSCKGYYNVSKMTFVFGFRSCIYGFCNRNRLIMNVLFNLHCLFTHNLE